VGENGGGWEWGEGIMHVGGKEVSKVVHGPRPGFEVCQGVITSLTASLNEVVDIQSVDVVEEGTILQRLGQGSVVSEVTVDG